VGPLVLGGSREPTPVVIYTSRETPPPSVHTCSPVLLLIVARVLWTARPPARPVLGAEATIAEPAGPMTFRCPLAVRSTSAHPPVARRRRSPWLPWTASVSGLVVSSAPYQMSSASPGPVHDLIVDSAPSARKPQAMVQCRGATPIVQWVRPVIFALGPRWVRSPAVAHGRQRSLAVINGSDEPQVAPP
jgi:hypothetical protein